MTVDVTLTSVETQQAAMVGALRHIEATKRGLSNRFGADPDNGWTLNIEGAAGELAVARVLDRYWGMPVNTFRRGGDVGQLQVRTRSRHHYELIVRSADRDTDIFILVTGRAPWFRVHGFMVGADAKRPAWMQRHAGRPAAYFVPQAALRPIEDLSDFLMNATSERSSLAA